MKVIAVSKLIQVGFGNANMAIHEVDSPGHFVNHNYPPPDDVLGKPHHHDRVIALQLTLLVVHLLRPPHRREGISRQAVALVHSGYEVPLAELTSLAGHKGSMDVLALTGPDHDGDGLLLGEVGEGGVDGLVDDRVVQLKGIDGSRDHYFWDEVS